jgi:hypothetical protein
MNSDAINLDQNDPDQPPMGIGEPAAMGDQGPNYPSLMVDNAPPALANFPDKGHAVVKYSVHHRSTQKGPKGKTRHSVGLHIHSIKPHKAKSSARRKYKSPDKEDSDAVDQYFATGG